MKVLYEDNHLFIVSKPAGLLTQPTRDQPLSLESEAIAYLKKKYNKEVIFLKTVHRIDKDVSGIVIFARSSKGAARMSDQIKKHAIKKIYIAEVEGDINPGEDVLVHYLSRAEFKTRVVSPDHPDAKRSELSYLRIKSGCETSLVEINLVTGRYHQIRARKHWYAM